MKSGPIFTLDNGRYEIRARIGKGNFGRVYRGYDTHQDEEVAIKVLGKGVLLDAVLREVQLQHRLREHANIVYVRNVGVAPPRAYIVMEYLCDGSAEDWLDRGRVGMVEAIRWIRNALDGLAHAHRLGVLHRDIRPSNLLLTAAGVAKLSDFGVAEDTIRARVKAGVYSALTSPEFLAGMGSSVQTDIWAVGCTLYRLLTGRYPFGDSPEPREVMAARYAAPQAVNPQVPSLIGRAIARALDPNPTYRYSSAPAMVADLLKCRVVCSWSRAAAPSALEAWETRGPKVHYSAELTKRSRAGFEVTVRHEVPTGLRRIGRPRRFRTEGLARRALAEVLRAVVQGKQPRTQ